MNKAAFFDAARPIFGGRLTQGHVEGMDFLLDYRAKYYPQVTDAQMAYILATAYWETAHTMQPVTEYGSKTYLHNKPYFPYIGRGYVQLTHRQNYAHYGLADTPEKALEPATAAHVLFDGILNGVFGGKLGSYVNANKCDYVNARRCVNVLDRAKEIATIAVKFKSALLAAAKAPAEVVEHVTPSKTIFDEIGDFFDWTKHTEKVAQAPAQRATPSPVGQIGYIAAAIIAAIGALNQISGAEWEAVISTPSHEGLNQILIAVALTIVNALAPPWIRWALPTPRLHK